MLKDKHITFQNIYDSSEFYYTNNRDELPPRFKLFDQTYYHDRHKYSWLSAWLGTRKVVGLSPAISDTRNVPSLTLGSLSFFQQSWNWVQESIELWAVQHTLKSIMMVGWAAFHMEVTVAPQVSAGHQLIQEYFDFLWIFPSGLENTWNASKSSKDWYETRATIALNFSVTRWKWWWNLPVKKKFEIERVWAF
jgi:hypothetical protein